MTDKERLEVVEKLTNDLNLNIQQPQIQLSQHEINRLTKIMAGDSMLKSLDIVWHMDEKKYKIHIKIGSKYFEFIPWIKNKLKNET